VATSPNHSSVGASNLNYFHWKFLALPLLAVAGRARRIHDRLAGYDPVPTVQSLVITQLPLYQSSLEPPTAGNESIHKLRRATRVAHSAIREYCTPCILLFLGAQESREWRLWLCAFPIPGNEKTGPGMQTLITSHLQHKQNLQEVYLLMIFNLWL